MPPALFGTTGGAACICIPLPKPGVSRAPWHNALSLWPKYPLNGFLKGGLPPLRQGVWGTAAPQFPFPD